MLLSAWLSKLIINRFCHYRTWGIVFARAEHAAGLLACRRLSLLLGASGPPAVFWTAAVFYPAPWRLPRPQAAPRPLYCSLAGRDSSLYYLRPNPLRFWTARRAIGTEPRLYLDRAKRFWNGRSAALVLFVGRRYYLRPIIRRSDLLEQASASWNAAGY